MQFLTWLLFLLTLVNSWDVSRLAGSWKLVGLEANGQAVPERDFKNVNWKLVIEKNRFKYTAGSLVIEGGFTTDGKKFDAKVTSPDGTTIVGIYRREGDRLKLCLDLSGDERPDDFKTRPGSNGILLVFKREKEPMPR